MSVFSTAVSKCKFLLPFLDFFFPFYFRILVIFMLEPFKLLSVYMFVHLIQICNALSCIFLVFQSAGCILLLRPCPGSAE